jgi:hypothetical protein
LRGVMNSPRIIYAPRSEATPESESSVLADVYAYLIKVHNSKQVAESAQPPNWRGKESDTKEGGQDGLERNAIHGAEGDRTERTGKDKHGFVHR